MIVETETGSIYLFDQGRVMRLRDGETTESALRRDGDWLQLLSIPLIAVGEPMRLVLQPLGEGYATLRITSRVTAIHTGEESEKQKMSTRKIEPGSEFPETCAYLASVGLPTDIRIDRFFQAGYYRPVYDTDGKRVLAGDDYAQQWNFWPSQEIAQNATSIFRFEEAGSTRKTIEELTAELEAAIKTARDLLGIDTIHATVDGVEYVVAPA